MTTAPDGSPVALYLRLPERTAEADLIHGRLGRPGTVLDLGCGTGRLAEPLARLGHHVTGVDNEPAMLAALRHTRAVCADITTLELDDRFDVVLLMSHFVNTADVAFVRAALATAARHVRPDGFVVVERHPPGWVGTATESTQTLDEVRYSLRDLVRADGTLTATVRYEFDGVPVDQRFSVRDVDDHRLTRLAAEAGLRFDSTLHDTGTLVRLAPERLSGA